MSVQKLAASASRQTNAVVVSAGLMEKTVKVRVGMQKWNKHIGKHFNHSLTLLVHDPRSSLRIGDVISISPGWRASKQVHHVVNSILAPFGEPVEARPPVPTLEERLQEREAKRKLKEERRKEKRRAESGLVMNDGNGERALQMKGKGVQEAEEVQMPNAETGVVNGVFGTDARVQDVEVEKKSQEVAGEEEPKKSKGWWRI